MNKTDFDKLWTELSTTAEYCGVGVGVVTKDDAQRIYDAGVEAERERCVGIVQKWIDAYPLDVFPNPESGKHGTVDTCSARAIRHAAKCIIEDFGGEPKDYDGLQKTIDIMDAAHALSYPKQVADIKTMLRVADKLDDLAVSHQSTECTKEWMVGYLRDMAAELRNVNSIKLKENP